MYFNISYGIPCYDNVVCTAMYFIPSFVKMAWWWLSGWNMSSLRKNKIIYCFVLLKPKIILLSFSLINITGSSLQKKRVSHLFVLQFTVSIRTDRWWKIWRCAFGTKCWEITFSPSLQPYQCLERFVTREISVACCARTKSYTLCFLNKYYSITCISLYTQGLVTALGKC